jgi:hypothetical protein
LLCVNSQSTLGMHVSLPENRGGSRIQTWNRYAYLMNNPLNATDPLGLYCGVDGIGVNNRGLFGSCGGDGPGDDNQDPWDTISVCIGCFPGPSPGPIPGPSPQPPPAPQPPQQPINFPNETLGLPNGFPTNPWGILSAFLPSNLPCPAGLSSLCAGISPFLDAEAAQTAQPGPGGNKCTKFDLTEQFCELGCSGRAATVVLYTKLTCGFRFSGWNQQHVCWDNADLEGVTVGDQCQTNCLNSWSERNGCGYVWTGNIELDGY